MDEFNYISYFVLNMSLSGTGKHTKECYKTLEKFRCFSNFGGYLFLNKNEFKIDANCFSQSLCFALVLHVSLPSNANGTE